MYKKFVSGLLLVIGIPLVVIPLTTILRFAHDLDSKDRIMNRNNTGVLLLDRQGQPFFAFYQARTKHYVPLQNIPPRLRQAVIAIEDHQFYIHPGFSLRAIARSLRDDLEQGQLVYGGSTITQQLVKNSFLNPHKSFLRKYQEIILAWELERRYSKDEILEMYLNAAYFGQGAFGIADAADTYFGKDPADLSLSESSFLASVLRAPSNTSQTLKGNPRQKIILNKMVEQGYITSRQATQAAGARLTFRLHPDEESARLNVRGIHFALMVKQALIDKFGEERIARSGFRIRTSLDLSWQIYAEESLRHHLDQLQFRHASNGAITVLDPQTGAIRALVGSKDWHDSSFGKVNMAITPRQPGSAFKPLVYATGFAQGILTPATLLHDQPTIFPGNYKPQNFDGHFRGPVLARRALANSLNIPSVEVISQVGVPKVVALAQALGIHTLPTAAQDNYALALGAGEVKLLDLTSAYATFANQGLKQEPTAILEISDKEGNVLYQATPHPTAVVSPQVAFLTSSILSDNKIRSEVFGQALSLPRPAAVKTGTTEDFRDAWTIGYTPNLAVGVWVGNNNNTPMDRIAGALGAAPIWRDIMEHLLNELPAQKFEPPAGIVAVSICRWNGLAVKGPSLGGYPEYFIAGTEPTKYCSLPTPTPEPTLTDEQKSEEITLQTKDKAKDSNKKKLPPKKQEGEPQNTEG